MNETPRPPAISVIVPVYNRLNVISRALDSVMRQSFKDFELIVVDDASTDHAADFVRRTYPSARVIRLEKNLKPAGARNRGLLEARGEFCAFLDSDDEWHPDFLLRHRDALLAAPRAVMSACDCVMRRDSTERRFSAQWDPALGSPVLHQLRRPLIVTMSVVMVRRSAIELAGHLDETLLICHDREWYLRLLEHGEMIAIPECLATKHEEGDNMVRSYRIWSEEAFRLLDTFFRRGSVRLTTQLAAECRSSWAWFLAGTAWHAGDAPLTARLLGRSIAASPRHAFREFRISLSRRLSS